EPPQVDAAPRTSRRYQRARGAAAELCRRACGGRSRVENRVHSRAPPRSPTREVSMNTYVILRRSGWLLGRGAGSRSCPVDRGGKMSDDIRWIRSYVMAEPDGGGLGTVCIYQATS